MLNQIALENIKESFKQIKGFTKYYISNYGRVYSYKTSKILKPQKHGKVVNGNSHKHYLLYDNIGVERKLYIAHRLVAEYFIDNPKGLPVVHHIDGNRANNHYKNLEWTTQKKNIRVELAKKVFYYNKTTNSYTEYPTIASFTKDSNITLYKLNKLRKNNIPITREGLDIWIIDDIAIGIFNLNQGNIKDKKICLKNIMKLSA